MIVITVHRLLPFTTRVISPNDPIGQFPKGNDTRTRKETHQDLVFCSKRRAKEAQECHIMDCHAGNPCELRFDLTDHNGDPIIRRNEEPGLMGLCNKPRITALKASTIGLCDGACVASTLSEESGRDIFLSGFFGFIGRRAVNMKTRNGNRDLEAKGPRLKAKSRSLKLASHTRPKKVGKVRWTMENGSGRMKKVAMMGRIESNLGMSFDIRTGIK
ncbi:hypothetical protein Tco_0462807 [Tanacetum coccineum]